MPGDNNAKLARLLRTRTDNYFVSNPFESFEFNGEQHDCLVGIYDQKEQCTLVQIVRRRAADAHGLPYTASTVVTFETENTLFGPDDKQPDDNPGHTLLVIDTNVKPYEVDPTSALEPIMAADVMRAPREDIGYIARILAHTVFIHEMAIILTAPMKIHGPPLNDES